MEADFLARIQGFFINIPGWGKEEKLFFHAESAERRKRQIHFCLRLLQPGGSCCPGGFLVGMFAGQEDAQGDWD